MLLDIRSNLYFNGACVGARVSFLQKAASHPLLFDIANDDLTLIGEDFTVNIGNQNVGRDIVLVENGNLLVPSNGEGNVRELTYGSFAAMIGHERLQKTDTELKKQYNQYNREIFGGTLPTLVCVYWTNKMTSCAGVCRHMKNKREGRYYDFSIGLSIPYHQKYNDEVKDTLVHEMIHVRHPGDQHGRLFRYDMYRINREFGMNLAVHATGHVTDRRVNFTYVCEGCGKEYPRARRMDLSRGYRCGIKSCRGKINLKDDYTDDPFDETDWGAGRDW